MSEFTEVTAENLKYLRGEKGLSQAVIAKVLGIAGNQISKIEVGLRELSPSEKKLLEFYFFGKLPEGIFRDAGNLDERLNFTETEWRIVQILATRAGQTAEDWICAKIREYLAFLDSKKYPPGEESLHSGETLSLAAEKPHHDS